MAIEFSRGCARWSYSGFHAARVRLAQAIGVDLNSMEGFGGDRKWATLKPNPLLLLLAHPDDDGQWTVDQCLLMAPMLLVTVGNWPEGDWDRQQFEALAGGMMSAAFAGEPLRVV